MFPVGFSVAVDTVRRNATSAMPDAPIAEDTTVAARPAARPMLARARVAIAAALRGVAAGASSAALRLESDTVQE